MTMIRREGRSRRGVASVGVAVVLASLGVLFAGSAYIFQRTLKAQGVQLSKKPIYPADHRTLGSLPLETKSWRRIGSDHIESKEIEEVLGTTNYISRNYLEKSPPKGEEPHVINLHAAYYTGMIDTVPHVPEVCNVAAGGQLLGAPRTVHLPLDTTRWTRDVDVPAELGEWYRTRTSDGAQRVRLPQRPDKIAMRVSRFERPGGKVQRAGYFFIANGDWVAHAHGVRLLSFRLQEKYAYYMKVQFASTSYDSDEAFAQGAASLLDELLGDLMLCVPDWVEVKAGTHPDVVKDRVEPDKS